MNAEHDPSDELLELARDGFEMEAPVMAGDEVRIERMVRRVEGQLRPRRDDRRWRYMLQGAMAGVLLAGVAVGSIQLARPLWDEKPAERRQPSLPAPPPVVPEREAMPNVGEAPAGQAPLPEPAVSAVGARRLAPLPARSAATVEVEPAAAAPSAAELFAAANRARVNGDVNGAVELSRRLQAEFPRSSEAVSSRLSLGLLFLQQGKHQAALDEFRLYRRLAAGPSQAEALWGEAQALRGLGRTGEERAVLEDLVARYPSSAFAGAAKKRIAALP